MLGFLFIFYHYKHILTTSKQKSEDWKRTFILQTIACCRNETCKLIIDGSTNVNDNVASEETIIRLKLQVEPHPQSNKVSSINYTFIIVTKWCLLHIFHSCYNDDSIECGVIPMIVIHILLN